MNDPRARNVMIRFVTLLNAIQELGHIRFAQLIDEADEERMTKLDATSTYLLQVVKEKLGAVKT